MKLVVIGLVFNFISVSVKAFTLVPTTVDVVPSAQAVFDCQHSTADIILWQVNGTVLGRNPAPDFTPGTTRDDNGNLVDTLTITAGPEYNGTEVVCVARFDDGSPDEKTEPALLLVGGFLRSPVSLNVTLNTVAEFWCQNPAAKGIGFTINGSRTFPDNIATGAQGSVFFISIPALPEYNQTEVRCEAYFANSPTQETDRAVMMIQGPLHSVAEVVRMFSTLSWKSPFSLDLTGVNPDIAYCVEVYSITCGNRSLVISDCSVTEPSYTSDVIMDGYIYEYTITPRSNVPGARNGTNRIITEQFCQLSRGQQTVKVNESLSYVTLTFFIDTGGQTWNSVPTCVVPTFFTISLTPTDGASRENLERVEINTTREGNQIILDIISSLPARRLWNFAVFANGCPSDEILKDNELSTHGFQNISVFSPNPGQVEVTGNFVPGSNAAAILVAIHNESFVQYLSGSTSVLVEGLSEGEYNVSVFTIEKDGHPFNRAVTVRGVTVIEGGDRSNPASIQYHIDPTPSGVCVDCEFLDDSMATECSAVVQLNSDGLTTIKQIEKIPRSRDTAHECIEGINPTDYRIGVVNGLLTQKLSESGDETVSGDGGCTAGCVVGIIALAVSVVLVLVLLVVAVLITILFVAKMKTRKRRRREFVRHETDSLLENKRVHDCEKGGSTPGALRGNDKPTCIFQTDGASTPILSPVEPASICDDQANLVKSPSTVNELCGGAIQEGVQNAEGALTDLEAAKEAPVPGDLQCSEIQSHLKTQRNGDIEDNITGNSPDSGYSQSASSGDHEHDSLSSTPGGEATTGSRDTADDASLAVDALRSEQPSSTPDAKDLGTELTPMMYSMPVDNRKTGDVPPYCVEEQPSTAEDKSDIMLTSTPMNGSAGKEFGKPIPPPFLPLEDSAVEDTLDSDGQEQLSMPNQDTFESKGQNYAHVEAAANDVIQPDSKDTDYQKIYVPDAAGSGDMESPSQSKRINAIEGKEISESDSESDVAPNEPYTKKCDTKKATESGYVSMDTSTRNPETEMSSRVEENSSVIPSDVIEKPADVSIQEEVSTFVMNTAGLSASEQAKGSPDKYLVPDIEKEADSKSPKPFNTNMEGTPGHGEANLDLVQGTRGHVHIPEDGTKNQLHVQDTGD